MCGRYVLGKNIIELLDEINHSIDVRHNLCTNWKSRFNIAPAQMAPVLANGRNGLTLVPMQWGLFSFPGPDGKRKMLINARSETLTEKKSFKPLLEKNRCLIPASGFYEWAQGGASKVPMYMSKTDGRLLYFAALWDFDPADSEKKRTVFTVITTQALGELSQIHERMPVLLEKDEYSHWLDKSKSWNAVAPLMKNRKDPYYEIRAVSTKVNSTKNDGADCLEDYVDPEAQTNLF